MNNIFFTTASSKTINLLRLPLAILVVILHCNTRFSNLDSNTIELGIYNFIRTIFSNALCHIAVPTFFFISGYLFFLTRGGGFLKEYKRKLIKRFYTLIIPYFIWNVIYIVLSIVIKYKLDYKHFFEEYGYIWELFYNSCSWGDVMQPLTGPFLYPLWFIRDLIILSIISPIIYILTKKLRIFYVTILFIIYILFLWPNIPGLSMNAIFFFSAGAYLAIEKKDIVTECKKLKNIGMSCFIILLVFIIYMNISHNSVPKNIFAIYLITSVISVINIGSYLTNKNIEIKKEFSDMSFFIYCIHHVFLIGLSIKISHKLSFLFFSNNNLIYLSQLILTPLIVLSFCYIFYKVIKYLSPMTLNILNGNRL